LKAFTEKVHFHSPGTSPENTDQVSIWRSLGQVEGHGSKKTRKSLFPQCKTSIDNNSTSITHTAVKVACSMRFSDQMVWLPSLSHHRKWPRIT